MGRRDRRRGRTALKFIVGLGNPGRRYVGTRHNIGFDVVEDFARREFFEGERRKFQALYSEKSLSLRRGAEKVLVLRPQAYMNLSGNAVRDLLGFYGVVVREPLTDTLLVVYDDLDLPEGRLRYRATGSAGGHLGVQSVIDCIGHRDFSRLRVGIGRRAGAEAADFVLEKVETSARAVFDAAVRAASQSISVWLEDGVAAAMNRFNGGPDDEPTSAPG